MHDEDARQETQVWRVRDGAVAFDAPAARTVLASAEAAGLPWDSSCRNGTCRTCMRRLAAGDVAYRIDWPGVLPDERLAGWFLPCVAYPRSDLVLADGAVQVLPAT